MYTGPAWIDTNDESDDWSDREFHCKTCGTKLQAGAWRLGYDYYTKGDVYCTQHCPEPPDWEGNHDGMRWCQRCAIERGDYWEWKATGVFPDD